jgi:hypothetical protein
MAGWDYYVLEMQEDADRQVFLDRLAKLGSESWELVSVFGGSMYFKRYQSYEDQLRVGVAAENEADEPLFSWVADESLGQKRITAVSSQDAGPGGAPHSHRVVAIVDQEMQVVKGATDEVEGHVHPVTLIGAVDEADGHTHTFSIESGGNGTTQYDGEAVPA